MWPFDSILFNRVKDLERTIEVLTGANSILTQELERNKLKEELLLEKIFNFTGLNQQGRINTGVRKEQQPINIGKKAGLWPQLKENLELKAREEYWAKKSTQESVNSLERKVMDKEDAY